MTDWKKIHAAVEESAKEWEEAYKRLQLRQAKYRNYWSKAKKREYVLQNLEAWHADLNKLETKRYQVIRGSLQG
jgi:hypothetical protein